MFTSDTRIFDCEEDRLIPHYGFNFTSLSEVNIQNSTGKIFDVIGIVTNIQEDGQRNVQGVLKRKQTIAITDETDSVKVEVWAEICDKLNAKLG